MDVSANGPAGGNALRERRAGSGGSALKTALCFAVLAAFGGLLVRCAFYGVHTPDESFYLTVPYRILLGDALMINEWQGSQFSAFLQYLPLAAFLKIAGSTEGIILFSRLLFVFCQTAVSVFIFLMLRRYGTFGALASALLFLVYVVECVEALDYYTMSLTPFVLIALLLFASDRVSVFKSVFIGVLGACAVTALPVLAVVYFVYTAAVCVWFSANRKKKKPSAHAALRLWGGITAGVVLTAAAFLVFLLPQASLPELFHGVKNLFAGFNHVLPFTPGKECNTLNYGMIVKSLYRLQPIGFSLSLALTAGLLLDFRRMKHRWIWIPVLCLFTLYYVVSVMAQLRAAIVQSMFSPYVLFVFTIQCYLLTKKKNRRFLWIWCAGVVYMICLGAISRALNYVGAIGCVISCVAFGPVAGALFAELRLPSAREISARLQKTKKAVCFASAVVCIVCCAGVVAVNAAALWESDRLDAYLNRKEEPSSAVLTEGPLKGIYVSEKDKEAYDLLISDLKQIRMLSDGRLYVDGMLPPAYLMMDAPPATSSAWYMGKPELLESYYQQDPSRVAGAVYVPFIELYNNNQTNYNVLYSFQYHFFADYPRFKDYTLIRGGAGYILIAPEAE